MNDKHLWHGRFSEAPADSLMAYTASIDFDVRLWRDDLAGSIAHAQMLGACGVLPVVDSEAIVAALQQVTAEFTADTFVFVPSDEDIHTAIERRVTEIAGAAGAKLHTGRSRNDQVATALRLFAKRELADTARRVVALIDVLDRRADEAGDAYLPGYTHMQRAQPVLLSHHLRAHAWALTRDIARLLDARTRLDVSPLGAGALAGTSLPIDARDTQQRLGFADVFANSLDAVSDRDFVAEGLFALTLIGVHLSRLGEEWVLWTSEEFGFATLSDRHATGSSMLPQKKNADIAELARGKAGRIIGNLTGVLATLKGLPLAYNRDLQEDKEPLFDSLDQVNRGLSAMTEMIAAATLHTATMQRAADAPALVATDVAEWLVARGIPFRTAHAKVGELVSRSLSSGTPLVDLVRADGALGADAAELFAPGAAVQRRSSHGAAGPLAAAAQRDELHRVMALLQSRLP
ncbi:MAG: argininosuccinate lyase [Ilumatobacteraceae bacterium]|nr:argininosuccinate lyase [Ilumatobacteraceae bacterium]